MAIFFARHPTSHTVICNSTLPTARRVASSGLLRKQHKHFSPKGDSLYSDNLRDFRTPLSCKLDLRTSEILYSANCSSVRKFRVKLPVPSSRVKQYLTHTP
jgi:hypothetical protein